MKYKIHLIIVLVVLAMVGQPSNRVRAVVSPSIDPAALAAAMSVEPGLVTAASFPAHPSTLAGTSTAIGDTTIANFPRHGSTYAVLSNTHAPTIEAGSGFADLGGSPVRGNTDFDVTILKIDLNIPADRDCLSFDFRFYSAEWPTYSNSNFNDAFIAELDNSTWTTVGGTIIAPDNFAFDSQGRIISVNAMSSQVNSANAAGTTFSTAAATTTIRALHPVTSGVHSLYLSIFDQTDHTGNSTVLVDNLLVEQTNGNCTTPSPILPDTIGVYDAGIFYLRSSNTTGFADQSIVFGDAGFLPIVGDWDGNGTDTIGVYNPANGTFSLRNSNAGGTADFEFAFGDPADKPIAGKWDNTMTGSGVGVYRNSNGVLYLKRTLATGFSDYAMIFGNPGDLPVAGDWDGNGYDSIGVYRPGTTTFYLSNQVTNGAVSSDSTVYVTSSSVMGVFAGDWAASGTSGVGVKTGGQIQDYLPSRSFVYGSDTALPIAGRWGLGSGDELVYARYPGQTIDVPVRHLNSRLEGRNNILVVPSTSAGNNSNTDSGGAD